MNTISKLFCATAVLTFAASAFAQAPGVGQGQAGFGGFNNGRGAVSPVDRLMVMDANNDGQLTANEVNDPRLRTMLNRADVNQDGTVTRAELTVMAGGQNVNGFRGGNQGFGGGQPGAGGPPAVGMPGGVPGGPGTMPGGPGAVPGESGPPPVGQIMPSFMQDQLGLTADQRAAITKLQSEVDAQLSRILTAEQQQQLQQQPGAPGVPPDMKQRRTRGRAQGQDQGRGQDQGQSRNGRGAGRPPADD